MLLGLDGISCCNFLFCRVVSPSDSVKASMDLIDHMSKVSEETFIGATREKDLAIYHDNLITMQTPNGIQQVSFMI